MKNSLLSKKNRKLLSDPLGDQNPITIQVLGICSALAITVQLQQALVMSMSVVFVMVCGNMIISFPHDDIDFGFLMCFIKKTRCLHITKFVYIKMV